MGWLADGGLAASEPPYAGCSSPQIHLVQSLVFFPLLLTVLTNLGLIVDHCGRVKPPTEQKQVARTAALPPEAIRPVARLRAEALRWA